MVRFIRTARIIRRLVNAIRADGISVTPLLLFNKDVVDLMKMKFYGSLIGLAAVVNGILLAVARPITEVNSWMSTCNIL